MPPSVTSGRLHRFRAGIIVTLFAVAVSAAAAIGWWYARESPPHQGPLILIAVDGIPAQRLGAYGGSGDDTSSIDQLARDSVVFEHAYTHSLQVLPAHTSILSGQLPMEHGVRDDAGFVLRPDVRTLAELLQSRGFSTAAAVSSFLLRPESGLAQGFTHFDADRPEPQNGERPVLERDGAATMDAAERWVESSRSRRFFLFVQFSGASADGAIARLTQRLRTRGDYDNATIVFVGDHGEVGPGMALDEASLQVPLFIKQPGSAGAGQRVASPVQHIDIVPTLLDLVRAPIPGSLRGRSLRPILDGGEDTVTPQPIYSESLSARFRFGGQPVFALTEATVRYRRGVGEELVHLGGQAGGRLDEADDTSRLRSALAELVGPSPLPRPARIEAADEDRYALAGLLESVMAPPAAPPALTADQQTALVAAHREAASLVGQKNYSAGIRALRTITRGFPMLAAVHYQLGSLLARTGRVDEAIEAFRTSRDLQPDSAEGARSLAEVLLRSGDVEGAAHQSSDAVALAERDEDPGTRVAAHATAARVALALKDPEAAVAHAEAAEAADPTMPVLALVRGRMHFDAGEYDEAVAELQQPAHDAETRNTLPELHLTLGESLVHLERYEEAEVQFREELAAFPRSLQAFTSLVMLYRTMNREAEVGTLLDELVATTPTPEGYALAARLWTVLGDRKRADALRSDARTRFRGDPSLALLGPSGRR